MPHDAKVRLVFKGELQPGRSMQEVKAGLPDALKISSEQVEGMFGGSPVVIRRGLPASKLNAYLDFLSNAGLCVDVEEEAPALPLEPTATTSSTDNPTIERQAEQVTCPQCGAVQPRRTLCRECGVDMPRYAAAQATLRAEIPTHAQGSMFATGASTRYAGEVLPSVWGLNFDGRLNRMRYCIYGLAIYAVLIIAALLVAGSMLQTVFGGGFPFLAIVFFGLVLLATLFYGIRFSVQRLHDVGQTGWLVLLSFVPFIGWLFWLILAVWPGNEDANAYGPPNPPNSILHQVIVWGLTALLVVLVVIGFDRALQFEGEKQYGPWHMQTSPEQSDGAQRVERM